ncbi:MAG: fused MFS/spermidine synthase [Verrucomicrobia bacterium]|nr:fused MFS/spermidine synthase [Verrucomicrobiota bacterium]
MPAFALTIFTGAFLLFQVQPLIGKYILPWFGGGPGVWTTCMLFFQLLLLGGYAYAHFLSKHLRPRTQVIVHLVLLGAALVSLPITPGDHWKPTPSENPAWQILALLAANLGLPYLVLSATGPLMQEWFRRSVPGASPYRLYALSNVGSLLALVSYPFYFETNFTRLAQARFWSWGLVAYALFAAVCAWRVWRLPAATSEIAAPPAGGGAPATPPTFFQRLLWVLLPACASVLLLAITNKICQDVAVIPFLWVLPLALYLLTFIISFDSPRWYARFWWMLLLGGTVVAACYALFQGADLAIVRQVVIFSALLFVGGMVCHGELYHLKPDPRHLTSFYLMISAGGALGGLFVALVAPAVFDNFYEFHLSVALLVGLLLALLWRGAGDFSPRRWQILTVVAGLGLLAGLDRGLDYAATWAVQKQWISYGALARYWTSTYVFKLHWPLWLLAAIVVAGIAVRRRGRSGALNWHRLACGSIATAWCGLVVVLAWQIQEADGGALVRSRNFYGVLAVLEYERENSSSHYYALQHGRITHGIQFADPERSRMITSYFGSRSGLGLAFNHFPRVEGRRIGLLGLGVGTIAAYAKRGDYLRIYEIDPAVKTIAEKPFRYLANSEAKIEVAMGDGRLSMENEPPQNLDFLIMDAFTSDAVPVHLLTKEAFAIYGRHLKPDGVILVNISNRYLNLRPVIENAAREFDYPVHHIECEDGSDDDDDGGAWWLYGNTWMVLSKNTGFMARHALRSVASPPAKPNDIPLWTDDYSSMFRVLQ